MENFYNTTGQTGATLTASRSAAKRQDSIILELFQRNPIDLFAPHDVQRLLGLPWPLTSVRRAISDLTERGLLEKTDHMRVGTFGKPVHTWRLSHK